MVNWPWSHHEARASLEAKSISGYGKKEALDDSVVTPTQQYQPRLPHPNNMANYNRWSNDPEASISLTLLTDIIAGVGSYREMSEGFENHKNKEVIDEFCKRVNLDEDLQQITRVMLAKGFCPVERLPDYDLKILPPETFYIYRDKYGTIQKYTQEYFQSQVLASWETPSEQENIILFKNNEDTSHPYGQSLLESIGPLLDIRTQMNEDIGKVLHRMGYPIPVMSTSRDKAALDKAIEEREPDQWITIGNVMKDEFNIDVIEIASRSQPHEWIDLINMMIAEGLHAPLLMLLKNSTEASATVVMESIDRFVNGHQTYLSRRVEDLLFKPQVGDPVPLQVWGRPKTGLEKVTLTELASVINSPKVTFSQAQALLKDFFPQIPDATPQEIDKFMNPPEPIFQQGKPFQKKEEPPQQQVEQLIDGINSMDTSLGIIETAFHEGRIKITDACRQADRAISIHMKRIYGNGWEQHRDVKFQEFIHGKLVRGKVGETYHVTVG